MPINEKTSYLCPPEKAGNSTTFFDGSVLFNKQFIISSAASRALGLALSAAFSSAAATVYIGVSKTPGIMSLVNSLLNYGILILFVYTVGFIF